MVSINLGDPNVVDNFKALDNLRSTGLFTDAELQEMYDKQVTADKTRCNSIYGSHIIRMYDELTELKGRWSKLLDYYDKHRSELDTKQQDLMMSQRAIMEEYIDVLEARIDYDTQLYNKEV